jgi:hypothetical protein
MTAALDPAMGLDDFRDSRRAGFIIQVAEDCAGIQNIGYHLSFRCRSRLSSSDKEGLPEKSPRVLSTSSSDTGSNTIRDPSCVTAMRVPGLMPKDARISAGITNCPLVLTEVICRITLTLYPK